MWSTGNENVERFGRSEGYTYARKLADFVRNLDDTRPVTNALCSFWGNAESIVLMDKLTELPEGFDLWAEFTREFAEPLDVVGYNYLTSVMRAMAKGSRPHHVRFRNLPQGSF